MGTSTKVLLITGGIIAIGTFAVLKLYKTGEQVVDVDVNAVENDDIATFRDARASLRKS